MLKLRLIPVLTYNGFALVKTKSFGKNPRMVGNPIQAARVFNSRKVDELVFTDIFATRQSRKLNLNIVEKVINECFMPVSIGGNVSTLEDINDLLKIGADKVVINSNAFHDSFINKAADKFGESTIILSVDILIESKKKFILLSGKKYPFENYIDKIKNYNYGELFLTSVNNEGTQQGFDIDLFNFFYESVDKPIIFNGGAGNLNHFYDLFSNTKIEAVASSSIFYFTQYNPDDIKKEIKKIRNNVRL
tara:strand:+ start:28918 stop:29661 length:744 start_codon:yes stop_codon:yes gene_type:complete